MTLSCADFQERVAALALGALEADEREACEAHLAAAGEGPDHARCRQMACESFEAAGLLGRALPPRRPRPAVWTAIEARLEIAAPAATAGPPVATGRRGFTAVATALAVAASLAAVFFWQDRNVWRSQAGALLAAKGATDRRVGELTSAATVANQQQAQCRADLEKLRIESTMRREAVALLERPGTKLIRLEPQGDMGYRAQALVNLQDNQGMVMASGLPRMPGKDFELWVLRGDAKLPAGLLRGDAEGNVLLKLDEKLLAGGPINGLAVTIEPTGGMTTPTGPIVMAGMMGI